MQTNTPSTGDTVETLHELNRGYIRSIQSSDVRWFEQHLAEDFVNTNPDGARLDRTGFLAQVARPSTVAGLDVHDVDIRLFDDTAIIHARTVYRKSDSQPGAGWYTDVWRRFDGRWLCISAHVDRK